MRFVLLAFWCLLSLPTLASSFAGIDQVVLVVLENTSYDQALVQPFQARLAQEGALLTNSFAITHPSQPNYVALIAGQTFGVRGDGVYNLSGRHLGDLLTEKGLSWRAYVEQLPSTPCYLGASQGHYVRKHQPFISFRSVQQDPATCANIVHANRFVTDWNNNTLPNFSLYVPDMNNDGHDTSPRYSDNWLKKTFAPLLANADQMAHTLFIVTYDEDDYRGRNQIYTVLVGANIAKGTRSSHRYDHYSVLKTIEAIFKLNSLAAGDQGAGVIDDVWVN